MTQLRCHEPGLVEVLGWSASAYQYGMLAAHWYWIGAIPAMLFLGIVMIPFFYVSKAHSVPDYLKLRLGEGAPLLSATSFAGLPRGQFPRKRRCIDARAFGRVLWPWR